jgi:hypothetical protein
VEIRESLPLYQTAILKCLLVVEWIESGSFESLSGLRICQSTGIEGRKIWARADALAKGEVMLDCIQFLLACWPRRGKFDSLCRVSICNWSLTGEKVTRTGNKGGGFFCLL